MKTRGFRAAIAVAMTTGLFAAAAQAAETRSVTVSPGGVYGPIIFKAERAAPTWRLTVDVGPQNCVHVEGSQQPNNAIWQAYFEARTGYFESDTSIHATELQFQRDFTGDLDCSSGGGGGGGGGKVDLSWLIHAQTEDNYYVVESEESTCSGETVRFDAIDGLGNPVDSTWTAKPSLGELADGPSVTIKDLAKGEYVITGTGKGENAGSDSAQLNVSAVASIAITAGGSGSSDKPAAVANGQEVTFAVVMAPDDKGGEKTSWTVAAADGGVVGLGAGRTVSHTFADAGTFTVTATCGDSSATMIVAVADDDDNIVICHHPPGNPKNTTTLKVPRTAWDTHFGHGDTLGACE